VHALTHSSAHSSTTHLPLHFTTALTNHHTPVTSPQACFDLSLALALNSDLIEGEKAADAAATAAATERNRGRRALEAEHAQWWDLLDPVNSQILQKPLQARVAMAAKRLALVTGMHATGTAAVLGACAASSGDKGTVNKNGGGAGGAGAGDLHEGGLATAVLMAGKAPRFSLLPMPVIVASGSSLLHGSLKAAAAASDQAALNAAMEDEDEEDDGAFNAIGAFQGALGNLGFFGGSK